MKNNGIKMTLGEMKKYIQEWFEEYEISYLPAGYDTGNISFNITDSNKNVLFSYIFKNDELLIAKDDLIVSTSGIACDEFREVIEKCYSIDIQLQTEKNSMDHEKI